MLSSLKWQLLFWCAIAAVVAVLLVAAEKVTRLEEARADLSDLKVALAEAQRYTPVRCDTIRDSILVYITPAVTLSKTEYKEEIADKALLDDIGETASTVRSETQVVATIRDTVYLGEQSRDSLLSYSDEWAEIRFSLPDSLLSYSVRDSITTYIVRRYRHRFLWWRWGVKGYDVKLVNFNPNCRIRYLRHITVGDK